MSNSQPLVAIGVLAYNRPEGIRKTLNALCSQHYDCLEIHVSDDCSPDPNVSEVIEEFCRLDKRLTLYKQDRNLGVIGNHRFLLSKMPAASKYIMWACDDDDWHPDYINVCVAELEKHPDAILCSTHNKWSNNGASRELDYNEHTHTLTISDPIQRYKKVLSNILWWNHSFYGVIRKSAADKVALRRIFAFDIHFIAQLSLLGPFIKTPHAYFTKAIGGSGSDLKKNLRSVKVSRCMVNYFPRIEFSRHLIDDISQIRTLNLLSKLKLSLTMVVMVSRRKVYGKSIKQQVGGTLHRLLEGIKVTRAWLKIGNVKLAKRATWYGLPLADIDVSINKKSL